MAKTSQHTVHPCGCKYDLRYRKWKYCKEGKRLKDQFFRDMFGPLGIVKRNEYFNHFESKSNQ